MRLLAKVLARPTVTDWLIRRAGRTPCKHVMDADGSVLTKRYWLFNPRPATGLRAMLPSIRIHHTMGRDRDSRLYNFTWNARTSVLMG